MTAPQALYQTIDPLPQQLSKNEILILEAELFTRIYAALKEVLRERNKNYFNLMKLNTEQENNMLEATFLRCLINDILSTEEYNLPGIAHYTGTPEDVIYEVAAGCNERPSLTLARKVIELHRLVRPQLYREIMHKITQENSP